VIYKISFIIIIALFLFNSELLWSQVAPAGPAGSGATGSPGGQAPSVPTPGDFPQYIVTPRDDLDNYDYSNMNKSNFKGSREDQDLSNFDKPNIQENNVEINSQLQKMEEERNKSLMPKEGGDSGAGIPDQVNTEEPVTDSADSDYVQPTQKISLYRWYDSDGILHVTDDFGSIPPEYQDSAFRNE